MGPIDPEARVDVRITKGRHCSNLCHRNIEVGAKVTDKGGARKYTSELEMGMASKQARQPCEALQDKKDEHPSLKLQRGAYMATVA